MAQALTLHGVVKGGVDETVPRITLSRDHGEVSCWQSLSCSNFFLLPNN